MKEQILPLRPHHGLCLGFFRGEGYSGEFVQNMARMKTVLEGGATVRLTDKADCICANCPNRTEDGGCDSPEKVTRYDREVLNRCGLRVGQELSYQELTERVAARILQPGHRKQVCPDCQWTELCK